MAWYAEIYWLDLPQDVPLEKNFVKNTFSWFKLNCILRKWVTWEENIEAKVYYIVAEQYFSFRKSLKLFQVRHTITNLIRQEDKARLRFGMGKRRNLVA